MGFCLPFVCHWRSQLRTCHNQGKDWQCQSTPKYFSTLVWVFVCHLFAIGVASWELAIARERIGNANPRQIKFRQMKFAKLIFAKWSWTKTFCQKKKFCTLQIIINNIPFTTLNLSSIDSIDNGMTSPNLKTHSCLQVTKFCYCLFCHGCWPPSTTRAAAEGDSPRLLHWMLLGNVVDSCFFLSHVSTLYVYIQTNNQYTYEG